MAQDSTNNQAGDNSTSGTPTEGKKKLADNPLVKLIVAVVVAFVAYRFYTEWVQGATDRSFTEGWFW